MKIAFGHMHYTPDVFWAMSLREWQACFKGYFHKNQGEQDTPMTSDELHEMMERYPDDGTGETA